MSRIAPLAFAFPALLLAAEVPASPGTSVHGRVIVVDEHGKPMSSPDVWVYLEDVHPPRHRSALPGQNGHYEIKQHHEAFDPHVLVVPTGATVNFPNLDAVEHNVWSPSDPTWDLGRYTTDKVGKSQQFLDPGEVAVYCDIHKAMSARIKVVDTTLFVPVQNSEYTFEDVPSGTYKVVAWMPDSTESRSGSITISATGGDVPVSELHLQAGPPPTHRRKDGSEYKPYP
jgi:plastocyanin